MRLCVDFPDGHGHTVVDTSQSWGWNWWCLKDLVRWSIKERSR